MGMGAVTQMAGRLMPYLTRAGQAMVANPIATSAVAGGVMDGGRHLMQGDILGALGGGVRGAIGGGTAGALTRGLVPGAQSAVGRFMGPTTGLVGSMLPGIAAGAVPLVSGIAGAATATPIGGAVNQVGQRGLNTGATLLGYNSQGEPLIGTPLPAGIGPYGNIPPVGASPFDVVDPAGAASAQRLTANLNALTMRDAANVVLPTVRKYAELAKKDDFSRNMAARAIGQNIATNAQMLQDANIAGLNMGATAAQQAGNAITQQYNYM